MLLSLKAKEKFREIPVLWQQMIEMKAFITWFQPLKLIEENFVQLRRDILCAQSELLRRIVARTSHTKA